MISEENHRCAALTTASADRDRHPAAAGARGDAYERLCPLLTLVKHMPARRRPIFIAQGLDTIDVGGLQGESIARFAEWLPSSKVRHALDMAPTDLGAPPNARFSSADREATLVRHAAPIGCARPAAAGSTSATTAPWGLGVAPRASWVDRTLHHANHPIIITGDTLPGRLASSKGIRPAR